MKNIAFAITLLFFTSQTFSQEIFGGINFGNSKSISFGSSNSPQSIVYEGEWDVLWKNKKRQLNYNGVNLKIGVNHIEGYKIGLGYKSVFGLNYNEAYNQNNIGIESYIGLSYIAPAAYTPIARYGIGFETGLGIRFRFFQNYSAKITYNLSYSYFDQQLEDSKAKLNNGFSIGFIAPIWVNKKSIFKRAKSLKVKPGEKW